MNTGPSSPDPERNAGLIALASDLRPELHRYCARLMGSIIDGEDVVQDTFIRAFEALPELDEATPLRPWLFRIAHNRAMDLLRSRSVRLAEPMDAAVELADPANTPCGDADATGCRQDSHFALCGTAASPAQRGDPERCAG